MRMPATQVSSTSIARKDIRLRPCFNRMSGIAIGTPGGVGAARTPPVWPADGDEVAAGIGVLVNQVRAD